VPDISTRNDLEHLLRRFYEQALEDPLLRHVFVDVVHLDLEAHLPRITDFWQRVLFGTGAYDGRPVEVHHRIHERVPLTEAHFARWLELWREAVAADFAGPVADRAVAHATRIASGLLRGLTGSGGVRRLALVACRGG
jgi:hemoglobin